MLYSIAIENTNYIFYCSVKPTYVDFLALTLITTNYCSGTFLALHNVIIIHHQFILTFRQLLHGSMNPIYILNNETLNT